MSTAEITESEIDDTDSWMDEEWIDDVTSWNIKNSVDAAEAMRRARFFQSQIDELTAIKLAQIDQVDRWYAKEVAKVVPKLDRYRIPLERFSDEREASLSYPAGKLARRKGSEVVEIEDEDAFINWALLTHDDFVRIPDPAAKPAKDEIKKAIGNTLDRKPDGGLILKETGEVVPGVAVVRNEPSHKLVFVEVEQ